MKSDRSLNNRELSWLAFNNRVLQEAQDCSVPLMERLRFLGIFSNNLDEFIKVRLANMMRMERIKDDRVLKLTNGYPAAELVTMMNESMELSQKTFQETYKSILSELEEKGIRMVNEKELTSKQKEYCRNYFTKEISQWLVPLMLRKTTKLPFLPDGKIYLGVKMQNRTSKNAKYAILRVPVNKGCPRFIELPSERGKKDIIFIDDIIRLCLDEIFFIFHYDEISAHAFCFLRDAQLTIDDDVSKSLIEKLEESLEDRFQGNPVRLSYDKEMPSDLLDIITSKLKLTKRETAEGGRYHMLRDLMKFPRVNPELENKNPDPLPHPEIKEGSSLLEIIRSKDILLYYPYHTFNHLIDFLREAAIDPKVKKIFITLYRTAERSKVINALIYAAKNGKEVIVLEELMARFDEEKNVENSDLLQKAGVKVIHGFKDIKVHSKLILIERKEKSQNRGYLYVGTGNFNEATARIYTDFGLFTTDQQAIADARAVFRFLLDAHRHFTCKRLVVSPYYMRKQFEDLIEQEIKNKQTGKKAAIYAKFNSLTDTQMIRKLYKASQAGVEVRLIVRGACCLQPQVKGLSEYIKVISIVDKYLEHARLVIFHQGGEEQTFILSADWMTRNLDYRVEVGIPILDAKIKKTLRDIFDIQWSDNVKARDLTLLGENRYVKKQSKKVIRSQVALYDYLNQEK
ncbi:MAG: polyphosphate kinase 1 [Bacteroides sp.]|nr:polyphosphate kinase 1 [Bacteroides sp.]